MPLEDDARVDYAFRVDGRWQLDPLNPRVGGSQIGTASQLAMPGFVEPVEAVPRASVADRIVRPVIAVAIDAAEDRGDWYFFNSNYLAYLARVVEWVDGHYSTVRAPEGRLHVGTSSGGRGALWAVLSRPDLFGNVGLFSANYSSPVSVLSPYATGEKPQSAP